MEKLYELHQRTRLRPRRRRHAAHPQRPRLPRRPAAALPLPRPPPLPHDHRRPGRGIVKAVNVAAQAFLRTVAKVVGGEVIDDAIAFFQAFEGMEEGFRRAGRRRARSCCPTTTPPSCWWPRRGATRSRRRTFFAAKLAEADIAGAGADRQPDAPALRRRAGRGHAGARPTRLAGHRPRRALPQPGRLPARGVTRGGAPRRPRRGGGAGAGGAGAVPAPPTSTTSTASPSSPRYLAVGPPLSPG